MDRSARQDRRLARPGVRTARSAAALAALAGLLLGAAAEAQNALGSGDRLRQQSPGLQRNSRGLDNNPQVGGGRANPQGRDIVSQARYNDAVVTGNVGGGKQFRGAIGYTAPFEFRGSTGSNALFNFYRETYREPLAGTQGMRGAVGVQTSLGKSTGRASQFGSGNLILQREGSGASVSDLTGFGGQGIDPSRSVIGGMRSATKSAADRASEPVTFRLTGEKDGDTKVMSASSLRGVYRQLTEAQPTGLGDDARRRGLATAELPEGRPASESLRPRLDDKVSDKVSEIAKASPIDTRVMSSNTAYERVLREMRGEKPEEIEKALKADAEQRRSAAAKPKAEKPGPGADEPVPGAMPPLKPAEAPTQPKAAGQAEQPTEKVKREVESQTGTDAAEFNAKLERLRERLMSPMDPRRREAERQAKEDRETKDAKEAEEQKDRRTPADNDGAPRAPDRPALKPEPGNAFERRAADMQELQQSARELLGGTRPRLKQLIDPSADPSGYTRHVGQGQALLAEGKWFDAEESFTRALVFRDADPIAAIGRVHAQMGAGMFLSAATNLRALLRSHPEMATVTYDAALLPRESRLESLGESLRDAAQRNDGFGRDAALLLAYLGYQTGNATDITAGMDAVARINEYLAVDPDPLDEVLRAVWAP